MLLENYPELQQLDAKAQTQLATELLERTLDDVVELPPGLLTALEERIANNDAHPEEVFTTEEVTARLAALKQRIAARKAHA